MSRSKRAERSEKSDSRLRWVAAIIAYVVSLLVLFRLSDWADRWAVMDRLREALRGDGYVILGWYFPAVLTGALLQSPLALRRRARLTSGWLTIVAFLAYGLAVAGLAALLAVYAPGYRPGAGRGDPGALYGVMLVCMLGGPALLVLSGAVFPARAIEPRRSGKKGRRDGSSSAEYLFGVLAVTALLGSATLLLLLVAIAVRHLPRGAWIPAGGTAFIATGAIAAGGIFAIALVVGAVRLAERRRLSDAMRVQGTGFWVLAGASGWFAVTGLLGAQLARVLPTALVSLLAVVWLPASGLALAWFFGRRSEAQRARSAPEQS